MDVTFHTHAEGDVDDAVRDMCPSAADMVDVFVERRLRFGTAESVTAGLVGLAVVVTPESGEVFNGAVVAYHEDVKHGLLGVRPGPVVCAAAAVEMARGAARLLGADVAVGTTGVAGPDTLEGQPVGTCFVAAAGATGPAWCAHLELEGTPGSIRRQAATVALRLGGDLAAAVWGGPCDTDGWLAARLAADIEASASDLPDALRRIRDTLVADRTNGESSDALTESLRAALRDTSAVAVVTADRLRTCERAKPAKGS